ncbi:glycosyltransferase family 2 protein [bacterium]|nr:glycosyltransferase family 2 protein [candidate division CSSED10-310 bacterium]
MISVVIPTWNGKDLLRTCLDSLAIQTCSDFEIIVVDNGSSDGTDRWIRETHPKITCITLTENRGFASAVNAGIKASNGEYVALLNNDTRVDSRWISVLKDSLREHPEIDVFASKVLIMDAPDRIDTAGDGFTIAGFGYKIGWLKPASDYQYPRIVFGASGCAALYRKKMFETIGLFDEEFFAFAEDLDLSFRALNAGFRSLYIPEALVYHKVRATAQPGDTFSLYHRNLMWLIFKNMPAGLLFLYAPHILANWILVGIRSLRNGDLTRYIRSLAMGFKGLPGMRIKRKDIQKTRRVSLGTIRKRLDGNWIRIHWMLMKSGRECDVPALRTGAANRQNRENGI